MAGCQGPGAGEGWAVICQGHRISSWGDENILYLTVVMAAPPCAYPKSHPIVPRKWVNYMGSELCLNKAFTKRKYLHVCTTMGMHLVPKHYTPKNGYNGTFHVMHTVPQLK